MSTPTTANGTESTITFTTQSDLRTHLDGLYGDLTEAEALALRDQVQHEGPGFGPENDWAPLLEQLDNAAVWTWLESDREGEILGAPESTAVADLAAAYLLDGVVVAE